MSTQPVRTKPPAAKSAPNLLEQIGSAWNQLTAGKKPAAVPPRPAPSFGKAKPKPTSKPGNKLTDKRIDKRTDKPESAGPADSAQVRREGTALQKEQARELSLRLPQKTEFKQGKANELQGLSNDVQLNIRKAEAFGSKLAHSRLIGVAQVGEGFGMVTDALKGLNGAINGTPKFFSDAGDLLTGRTKAKPGEMDAGKLSGAGKFAWGAGAGLIDTAARLAVPGDWRDNISSGMQQGQQALDNGYRRVVKKIGIDPDSKAYGVASTVTQVAGTLATMGRGGKVAPAAVTTSIKRINVTRSFPHSLPRSLPSPGNPVTNPVTNPAVRAAIKESSVAKNPNSSNPTAASSGLDNVLAQVNQHLQLPEFKNKLAKSNSPAEIQRQNQAIRAMRDDGKVTASLIQSEGGGAVPASPSPPSALGRAPKHSNHPMTVAMKMRYFGNTVQAIANNTLFDNYLSAIHGKPVVSILKGSTVFNKFIDDMTVAKIKLNPDAPRSITVGELTARYRTASVRDLPRGRDSEFLPHTNSHLPSPAHNTHTAFGAVSKLGEVMANTNALSLDLLLPNVTSWASRGVLPGKGKTAPAFWRVDVVKDWVDAEKSLAGLETASKSTSGSVVSGHVQTLMGSGFLPKGSALAKHLETVETTALARDSVFSKMPTAQPADISKMMKAGRALEQDLKQGLEVMAGSARQSRAHVMHQSFGTPATTYALTTRHAAAARYMQTIEGQPLAVFDANKYRLILKEVQMEAGPALKTGPVWHKQMLKTYDADHFFQDAMNTNPAMGQAWRDYKAQFGVK